MCGMLRVLVCVAVLVELVVGDVMQVGNEIRTRKCSRICSGTTGNNFVFLKSL